MFWFSEGFAGALVARASLIQLHEDLFFDEYVSLSFEEYFELSCLCIP